MNRLILFALCFVSIYFLYLLTVVIQKKKETKYTSGQQVQYFVRKYGLDFSKISAKKFINLLSLTNSLIMSITILVISFIPNIIVKMLVAFILLVPLILIGYDVLGMYIKKEGSKNV